MRGSVGRLQRVPQLSLDVWEPGQVNEGPSCGRACGMQTRYKLTRDLMTQVPEISRL
jgi:hypothetical protein